MNSKQREVKLSDDDIYHVSVSVAITAATTPAASAGTLYELMDVTTVALTGVRIVSAELLGCVLTAPRTKDQVNFP